MQKDIHHRSSTKTDINFKSSCATCVWTHYSCGGIHRLHMLCALKLQITLRVVLIWKLLTHWILLTLRLSCSIKATAPATWCGAGMWTYRCGGHWPALSPSCWFYVLFLILFTKMRLTSWMKMINAIKCPRRLNMHMGWRTYHRPNLASSEAVAVEPPSARCPSSRPYTHWIVLLFTFYQYAFPVLMWNC